ncbi:hypothetical protein JRO89_XS02G0059900 [Xanthoceras sorbifolium]|uniref:Upstream activation factor subunit spp27-like n=1 Tax=Xanthoceras sorbifolium TaxID=99658 RepID=A0ABQ8IG37_9ROSI|nr:hypothetical protein JRO89_XS02G0059900 [Xanthoceras sorbifolium]
MVSDSDLVTRLCQILRTSDLDTATAATVRRQLEQDFNVDLSDRKAFVRDQIDIFLRNNQNAAVQGDEDEDQEAEEQKEESDSQEAETKNVDKEVKKRGGGFNKLCSLSPELQKLCGVPELARTEVVKKIWAYIRENSLQDPKNKRKIICDESFHALFRVKSIDMFKMNKALTKHIWPLSAGNVLSVFLPLNNSTFKEQNFIEVHAKICSRSTKVDKDVKKRGGGFTKVCSLSPQLQTLLGVSELARTEVVKKLWIYIRENNLQDPKNKRNIICDESLHALFRVNSINMFKMNKALSRHIWPLDEEEVPAKSTQKGKRCKQMGEGEIGYFKPIGCQLTGILHCSGADEPNQKEKRQKKGSSGFLAPLPLSDALMKFFGTGENVLSRADVVKRMWAYIKQNDLQTKEKKLSWKCKAIELGSNARHLLSLTLAKQANLMLQIGLAYLLRKTEYEELILLLLIMILFHQDPSDKRNIICDDKLKELFEVDSFHGFSVTKLLTAHFIKM